MTEDLSELNLCPNCGKENLPMATRCVHCGSDMESLFTISGQTQLPYEEAEDSLPDIIEEIRNDPALQVPGKPEPNPESQTADQGDEPTLPADQMPNWLAKVRERAHGEEDAIGGLVSGTIAMDATRSEERAAGVEGEFNAWINRIREKSQQETSARARRLPNETEDSDQVPEWLQRIRALRPRPEDEITHEVKTPATYSDGLPREWTDEALQELRRQALEEDQGQETELLPDTGLIADEQQLPVEPESEENGETVPEQPEPIDQEFHNISDNGEEYPELVPGEDMPQLSEVEEKEIPEEMIGEDLEQEPAQEIPSLEDVVEEPTPGLKASEEPEEGQPAAIIPEEESEGLPNELEQEPEEEEQPADSAAVPPDLLLLRDQQDRASLLASLIEEEGRVTAGKQAIRKPSGRAGRLVVALLLLFGLIVSILISPAAIPTDTPRSLPALALSDQIQTLVENDKVLVVLDYQAATSRELESLTVPLLAQLQTRGAQLSFLTTQPSGLFLAQSLLEQAGLPANTEMDFLPGSYLNLIGWAVNPPISATGDDLVRVKNLYPFKLVLLVSDSSDNIRGWLEQIAPWIESLRFAAVTTQMESPVLAPYFDSGQLVGYSAGVADGSFGAQADFNYRAYRVGLLLMLVMLLLGMISKGEADAIRKEEERTE